MDSETSPRRLSCEVQNALCGTLGYLDLCLDGDIPSDKLRELLVKAQQQAQRAIEADMKLFKAIGADRFPHSSQYTVN
jgi:hypothetical protein